MEHAKHSLVHGALKCALCACTLAALLALIWALPLTASAAETSGTCGDGVTWSFDAATGTLEISGNGVISNWTTYRDAPWYAFSNSIKTVHIEGSIVAIGDNSFIGYENIESITIPPSVERIGRNAFYRCTGLTTIYYNATKAEVSSDNFIFDCAGQDGTGITVYIGANVTCIPANLFKPCEASDYPKIKKVEFADGSVCTEIGEHAFQFCADMTEIKLPMSLVKIRDEAFLGCSGLASITIPPNVQQISARAFEGCNRLGKILFTGPYPYIEQTAFTRLSVSAYYPQDDASWPDPPNGSFGGSIIWNAHQHTWTDETVLSEATCASDGAKQAYCAFCDIYQTTAIPARGHTWDAGTTVREPSCRQEGEIQKTCTTCRETQSISESKLEHEYGEWKIVSGNKLIPPIVKERTCIYCADIVSTKDWSNIWITVLVAVALVGVVIGVINYIKAYKK